MKCERLLDCDYLLHTLTVASMGTMVRSRNGVRSFACRKFFLQTCYQIQKEMRFFLPCRANSLEFRGVGEQQMSSPCVFVVWATRMTIFPTSYCSLHITWKARVGPQWYPLKGHRNSVREAGLPLKHQEVCLTHWYLWGVKKIKKKI